MMPVAAGVFFPFLGLHVPPAAAGISELLSSVPVIVLSLLLNRFSPKLPDLHAALPAAAAAQRHSLYGRSATRNGPSNGGRAAVSQSQPAGLRL